jgi:hypothetical protein
MESESPQPHKNERRREGERESVTFDDVMALYFDEETLSLSLKKSNERIAAVVWAALVAVACDGKEG